MVSTLRIVLAVAALLPGVSALHLRGNEPANSKVVSGPDCGHVKKVISKFTKASKVGKLAGKARGAISAAEAAAGVAEAAEAQAEEIGSPFKDGDGDFPKAIEQAIKNAEDAAKDATAEAAKLETELGTFKTSITKTDFSGEGVSDAELVAIEDLTKEVVKSAKDAREVAAATVKKAEKVKDDYLKDSANVGAFSKKVLDSATAALKEATDVGTKSGHLVGDAKLLHKNAGEAKTGLETELAADESDQGPVLQAFIDDLDAKIEGVSDGADEAKTAIDTLETDAATLKEKNDAVKVVYEAVRGGANAPGSASADITAAEAALDAVEQDLVNVKASAKTLMARQAKLKAKYEEAQKKLPPPGP
jgi:hypothetical protein